MQLWGEVLSLLAVFTIVFVVLVQGAVAAYLLLGVAYAYAYQIDSHVNPAAIATSGGRLTTFMDWIYFSFCTLSTVGYGDIVPTSRVSRSLAIAEGVSGQLYLAILIARLVAMQVSGTARSDSAYAENDRCEYGAFLRQCRREWKG